MKIYFAGIEHCSSSAHSVCCYTDSTCLVKYEAPLLFQLSWFPEIKVPEQNNLTFLSGMRVFTAEQKISICDDLMNLWSCFLVPRWQSLKPTSIDALGWESSIRGFQRSPSDSSVNQVDKTRNRKTRKAECDGLLVLPEKVLSCIKMG